MNTKINSFTNSVKPKLGLSSKPSFNNYSLKKLSGSFKPSTLSKTSKSMNGGCNDFMNGLLWFIIIAGIVAICIIFVMMAKKDKCSDSPCGMISSCPRMTPITDRYQRERFVRSLPKVFATSTNLVEPLRVSSDVDDLDEPEQDKESFTYEEQNNNGDTPPEYSVKKASDGTINSSSTKSGRRHKRTANSPYSTGKMGDYVEVDGDKGEMSKAVPGIATGNPRLNNPFLHSIMIDDRGEGFNSPISKPIETFGPAISTNSRLAGSSMNITPILGACFKQFDTQGFFESNTPERPKLNIMKGEPLPLKYEANNTM